MGFRKFLRKYKFPIVCETKEPCCQPSDSSWKPEQHIWRETGPGMQSTWTALTASNGAYSCGYQAALLEVNYSSSQEFMEKKELLQARQTNIGSKILLFSHLTNLAAMLKVLILRVIWYDLIQQKALQTKKNALLRVMPLLWIKLHYMHH